MPIDMYHHKQIRALRVGGAFFKNRVAWWRGFFQDLEAQHILDTISDLNREFLWYCFSDVLQNKLNNVKENWKSHYIRKSRCDTVHGRPDSLFFLPEHHGGSAGLLLKIPDTQLHEISNVFRVFLYNFQTIS